MSCLHSLEEGTSQEQKQSENQDTATADAGQLEHGAGDDDASSSSSITEGGIIDRPIKVEDAVAAYEQRLEDWVPAVEDSGTTLNVTVPGWKQISFAELEAPGSRLPGSPRSPHRVCCERPQSFRQFCRSLWEILSGW
jgi:hypothetical protein